MNDLSAFLWRFSFENLGPYLGSARRCWIWSRAGLSFVSNFGTNRTPTNSTKIFGLQIQTKERFFLRHALKKLKRKKNCNGLQTDHIEQTQASSVADARQINVYSRIHISHCLWLYLYAAGVNILNEHQKTLLHTHTKKCVENYVLFTHNSLDVLLLQLVAFDHIDYNNV